MQRHDWPNGEDVPVDEATMRARRIPRCLRCRAVARPNILMFGDGAWIEARAAAQQARFDAWLDDHGDDRLVVIELGAGSAIPTIRWHSEQLGRRPGATVVRVNPREPEIRAPHLSIASGAREALERIRRGAVTRSASAATRTRDTASHRPTASAYRFANRSAIAPSM